MNLISSLIQTVITSKCAHLQSEMKALCSQPHHVFTPYELSQIILKLLTLLSATATIDYIVQPIEEDVKIQVKTKTDDGGRPSQSSINDLDISNHANFDWGDMEPDIDVVEQVETKTDDGGRPTQGSIDDLDISNHANFDWGDMEPVDDRVNPKSSSQATLRKVYSKSSSDLKAQDDHVSGRAFLKSSNRRSSGDLKAQDYHMSSQTFLKSSNRKSSCDLKTQDNLMDSQTILKSSNRKSSSDLKSQSDTASGSLDESSYSIGQSRGAFYKRNTTIEKKKTVSLQFDNVGYIIGGAFSQDTINDSMMTMLSDGKQVVDVASCGSEGRILQDSCGHRAATPANAVDTSFALPYQAREALLSVVILLLNKKGELESISNSIKARKKRIKIQQRQQQDSWWFSSLFGTSQEHKNDEWMLILNWQPLLRLLIRTTPFLNTQSKEPIRIQFLKNQTPLEKKTVLLITGSRKFFDQGIRPKGCDGEMTTADSTARELWHYVKRDLTSETHPNSYFRALVILYLFHPSECSRKFYLKHMPRWMEKWRCVDQSAETDFLWVVMFCRARRYVREGDFDWGRIKRHLEHVGPMLEDNRWNDRPARRMSGASSVMDLPVGLFDELHRISPLDETLDVDEEVEKEALREDFIREYNNGSRAKCQETLPDRKSEARNRHFAECRRLSQSSTMSV
jgi:hypothetical protein